MSTKTVSQLDAAGYFAGLADADESPLEPGTFLLPGGCVDVPAPDLPAGKAALWTDGGWVFVDPPAEPAAPPPPDAPPPDWRSLIMEDFSERREVYLNRLTGIALFMADQTITDAAATFRQRLLDLPADPTVTGATSAEELTNAILTLYRTASAEASAAAPAGKVAFDKIAR